MEATRHVFDQVAATYDRVRPGYSWNVIDRIAVCSGLKSTSRILEIGAGTGQLTSRLASVYPNITALEPGLNMAAIAKKNCHSFQGVRIIVSTFEDWVPGPGLFDLVVSAQAFHWIDPDIGIKKAADLLVLGGSLILIWHQDDSQNTEFYRLSQPLYKEYFTSPAKRSQPALADKIALCRETVVRSGRFNPPAEEFFDWERSYSGKDYLDLLRTFSDHAALHEPFKSRFFKEMEKLIAVSGGHVKRTYRTILIHTSKK